ncbi:MAG: YesL family protein [Roseburia sp.]|nr:YesL family protein [Roseburia sp.]
MWNRIFDMDNVVWRTIDKIGKIFLLNLLWLVCSLPIFTIGASTTALIYSSMKLHKNEGYWHQNFFSSFKENFKQATAIFLLYLAAGVFLAVDFVLGNQAGNTFGILMQGAAGILFVPYFLSLLYVFGVQAKFVNPVKATIRYSFFMALRNMKGTIQMAILVVLFVWVNTTVLLANFLSLIYGFGLMGYFFAAYYQKAFAKYIEPQEEVPGGETV